MYNGVHRKLRKSRFFDDFLGHFVLRETQSVMHVTIMETENCFLSKSLLAFVIAEKIGYSEGGKRSI
jgi:hypothetical protein